MEVNYANKEQDKMPAHLKTGPKSLVGVVKFTALAALLAMFGDAAVAHAMLWGNDPYWTYWITDGLLMSTVFGLGTSFFGVGIGRGAILTAVHIFLLTTYYWTLSPIGLPSHGEWLDLERTWITGLPVHFSIYYIGYLLTLWLWQHRKTERIRKIEPGNTRRTITLALIMAAAITIILGILQTVIKSEFPGATWFIVRIAVSFPFIIGWWALAGNGRVSGIAGGLLLAFLLITYGHYLAPIGLPDPSLRIFAENPPSVDVHWLSYRDAFLIILPATLVVTMLAFYIVHRYFNNNAARALPDDRIHASTRWSLIVAAATIIIVGAVVYNYTGPDAHRVAITAGGAANRERGTFYSDQMTATEATIELNVENANTHRTPLPPHDKVNIKAHIMGTDGSVLDVLATQPMVADPQGRFTTWAGVGYNVWHHGRSKIGSPHLPPIHSKVAVYALGNIIADGRTIATGVPVHVMTTERSGSRLELQVGDPAFPIAGIPDGHLRIAWASYTSNYARTFDYARYAWGGTWLILLLLLVFMAAANGAKVSNT